MSIRPQESVRQRDGHQGRRELRGSWGEQGTSLKQGRSCVSHFPVAVGDISFHWPRSRMLKLKVSRFS